MVDEVRLNKIAKNLLLHGNSCIDLGLYNGRMGMVLFLFHYARHTGLSLHQSFANEMLDDVLEDTSNLLPITFSTGLCGIGWGIEYLIQNGFVQENSDEILEELDIRVMEFDIRRISDISLDKGLEGIACYVLSRLKSPRNGKQPFDISYIEELKSAMQRFCINASEQNNLSIMLRITETLEDKLNDYSWKIGLKMLIK